jgi:hypothetical protein
MNKDNRPINLNGGDQPRVPNWAEISPGGRAAQAEFPAQAQVAAWARGERPAGPGELQYWAARLRKAFGPKLKKKEISFFFQKQF